LKITYIYQYFGTPAGSWSTRVYEFTKRWVKEGHQVTVITSPYDKSDISAERLVEKQIIEGINLVVINAGDSNRYSKAKRVFQAVKFAVISSWFALKIKADVVISSSGPITVGFPHIMIKLFTKRKMIFEVRDLWPLGAIELGLVNNPLGKLGLWFEGLLYRSSHLVVAASKGMEESILTRYPSTHTITIPNVANNKLLDSISINKDTLPDWAIDPKNTILIYAGSLGLMDAVDEVVEAFVKGQIEPNIKLVLIGDGSERKELEQMVVQNNLQEQIVFTGLIPKTKVYEWYSVAKYAFVLFKDKPVLATSSPNKLFDAITTHTPIIQNTTGWISRLIENNDIGLNVISGDVHSMIDAIRKTSALHISKRFQQNLENVSVEYDIDFVTDQYLKAIKKL